MTCDNMNFPTIQSKTLTSLQVLNSNVDKVAAHKQVIEFYKGLGGSTASTYPPLSLTQSLTGSSSLSSIATPVNSSIKSLPSIPVMTMPPSNNSSSSKPIISTTMHSSSDWERTLQRKLDLFEYLLPKVKANAIASAIVFQLLRTINLYELEYSTNDYENFKGKVMTAYNIVMSEHSFFNL
ncbi:8633_t:CDS:2 [Entrophospora sp. SA101]|nr:8633_t:CDS:2 [Entrophospora sp. SA101]